MNTEQEVLDHFNPLQDDDDDVPRLGHGASHRMSAMVRSGDVAENTYYRSVAESLVSSSLRKAMSQLGISATRRGSTGSKGSKSVSICIENDKEISTQRPLDIAMCKIQHYLNRISRECKCYHKLCDHAKMTDREKRHYEAFHRNIDFSVEKDKTCPGKPIMKCHRKTTSDKTTWGTQVSTRAKAQDRTQDAHAPVSMGREVGAQGGFLCNSNKNDFYHKKSFPRTFYDNRESYFTVDPEMIYSPTVSPPNISGPREERNDNHDDFSDVITMCRNMNSSTDVCNSISKDHYTTTILAGHEVPTEDYRATAGQLKPALRPVRNSIPVKSYQYQNSACQEVFNGYDTASFIMGPTCVGHQGKRTEEQWSNTVTRENSACLSPNNSGNHFKKIDEMKQKSWYEKAHKKGNCKASKSRKTSVIKSAGVRVKPVTVKMGRAPLVKATRFHATSTVVASASTQTEWAHEAHMPVNNNPMNTSFGQWTAASTPTAASERLWYPYRCWNHDDDKVTARCNYFHQNRY